MTQFRLVRNLLSNRIRFDGVAAPVSTGIRMPREWLWIVTSSPRRLLLAARRYLTAKFYNLIAFPVF